MNGRKWDFVMVDDELTPCGFAIAHALHRRAGVPYGLFFTSTLYAPAATALRLPHHPLLVPAAYAPSRFRVDRWPGAGSWTPRPRREEAWRFSVRLESVLHFLGECWTMLVWPAAGIFGEAGRRLDEGFPGLVGFLQGSSLQLSDVTSSVPKSRPPLNYQNTLDEAARTFGRPKTADSRDCNHGLFL